MTVILAMAHWSYDDFDTNLTHYYPLCNVHVFMFEFRILSWFTHFWSYKMKSLMWIKMIVYLWSDRFSNIINQEWVWNSEFLLCLFKVRDSFPGAIKKAKYQSICSIYKTVRNKWWDFQPPKFCHRLFPTQGHFLKLSGDPSDGLCCLHAQSPCVGNHLSSTKPLSKIASFWLPKWKYKHCDEEKCGSRP